MFDPYCPVHGGRVLLTTDRLRGLSNLAEGVIALELECYDGERLLLLTGSQIDAEAIRPTRP